MNKRITGNNAMAYHVLPPKGLLNDPNGLVHFKGVTHVFFQWNPGALDHGYKAWGHAVTKDLVTYDYHEPALLPDQPYDKNGCYSGSAWVHEEKLYLFYTGNVKNENGERESYQCVAVSEDGFTFTKLGPVIEKVPGYTAHVRDPKVFPGAADDFYMILGAQRDNLTGDTLVFHSKDLLHWTFQGSLLEEWLDLGYMWECPDLLQFPKKDVFLFSPQGLAPEGIFYQNIFQTGYVLGHYEEGVFKKDPGSFEELDRGFEFYAPQSFQMPDGRTLLMGWMGTMPKEKEETMPTNEEGWAHHLSILREVTVENGILYQRPVKELAAYFQEEARFQGRCYQGDLEKVLKVTLSTKEHFQDVFELSLDEHTIFTVQEGIATLTRIAWNTGEKETRSCVLSKGLQSLSCYLDGTSLELFLNDGEEVFSSRVFFQKKYVQLKVAAKEDYELLVYSFQESWV